MINEAKAVAARLREGWTYGLLSEAADTIDALVAEVERLIKVDVCRYPHCKCPTENPCLQGLPITKVDAK